MLYHVIITDVKGIRRIVDIIADNLLEAGMLAEDKYEEDEKEKEGNKSADT